MFFDTILEEFRTELEVSFFLIIPVWLFDKAHRQMMHGEVRERLESEIKKVDKKLENVTQSIEQQKVSEVLQKEAVTTRTTVGRLSAMRNLSLIEF